ncbi:protease III [Klebsiella michiganensis]|uniref:Protease III n=1 Tax=Klebsiella michiganensis TaxID=1134687 RepID=A0A7H4M6W7_9ENTR|nr:protease III [Klebsiella michiganensis]
MVNANGYTQHLPELFNALLDGYFSYTPTEEQLEQAKSWYAQMMDSADKGKAYDQAIMPIQMVSQVPYFQREERRALLPSITLKEVLEYRDNLKAKGRPELMVIGNLTADQSTAMARQIQKQLAPTATSGAVTKTFWSIVNSWRFLKKRATVPIPRWPPSSRRRTWTNTPALRQLAPRANRTAVVL